MITIQHDKQLTRSVLERCIDVAGLGVFVAFPCQVNRAELMRNCLHFVGPALCLCGFFRIRIGKFLLCAAIVKHIHTQFVRRIAHLRSGNHRWPQNRWVFVIGRDEYVHRR